MTQFSEKVAVISGAGIGIGQEPALLMPSLGAKAVVNDLGRVPQLGSSASSFAQQVVDKIVAAGGAAVAETSSAKSGFAHVMLEIGTRC